MHQKLAFLFLATTTLNGSVQADTWQEREALSQAVREIQALQALSDSARAASDRDARIKFDYAQLAQDLTAISEGIQQYLSKPLDPVMPPEELEAEYTQTQPRVITEHANRQIARRMGNTLSTTDTPPANALRPGR